MIFFEFIFLSFLEHYVYVCWARYGAAPVNVLRKYGYCFFGLVGLGVAEGGEKGIVRFNDIEEAQLKCYVIMYRCWDLFMISLLSSPSPSL